MHPWLAATAVLLCAGAPAQNILTDTGHTAGLSTLMLNALGITPLPADDQTCEYSPTADHNCVPPLVVLFDSQLIAAGIDTSQAQYPAGSTTPTIVPNPHVPYKVLNEALGGYSFTDQLANYPALIANDSIINKAYCLPAVPYGMPSPVYATIMHATTMWECEAIQPAESIEFSMSLNYKGFDVSSGSAATGLFGGVLYAMRNQHPTWTWQDIKGALRQTACGWPSGWVAVNLNCGVSGVVGLGFGNVDYNAAVAVSSTSAIYLQSPVYTIVNNSSSLTITIYPYMQTRRAREEVYVGGNWPPVSSVNEMTAAQIAASGAVKIIDDGGSTGVQTFNYYPAITGRYTVVVLTLDASGNGSRVESYMPFTESLFVGGACTL